MPKLSEVMRVSAARPTASPILTAKEQEVVEHLKAHGASSILSVAKHKNQWSPTKALLTRMLRQGLVQRTGMYWHLPGQNPSPTSPTAGRGGAAKDYGLKAQKLWKLLQERQYQPVNLSKLLRDAGYMSMPSGRAVLDRWVDSGRVRRWQDPSDPRWMWRYEITGNVTTRPALPTNTSQRQGTSSKRILDFVRFNPGRTAKQIFSATNLKQGTATARLYQLSQSEDLVRQERDGVFHYSVNMKVPQPAVPQPGPKPEEASQEPEEVQTPEPQATQARPTLYVETMAKEFFWQTQSNDLRKFVEWLHGSQT